MAAVTVSPAPRPPARSSRPAAAACTVRAFRFWLTNYRRTWQGSIYSSIANPVLYLGAMGLGLGSLVNHHGTARLGGVSYLAFIAPGLLAATAMMTAVGESTYPVLGSVKWLKTYQAAVSTPLRPADLLHGHLLFTTMRLAMNCGIFLAIMSAFGTVHSWWGLAALPVAVLTGLAFAAPIEAWAIALKKENSFAILYRFGMIPLFLFSATFFPLSQLPGWAHPIAYATPLWHGVALTRELSLGTMGATALPAALVHVGYLAALAAAGIVAGERTYRRRLYV
jgi:lipooligosaccharide transport system permease protein